MTARGVELLEISDLIIHHNVDTLERVPVQRGAVVEHLRNNGQQAAARVVAGFPVLQGDTLDPTEVDRRLLLAHTELQRLSEEFLQADRLRLLLSPVLTALRTSGVPPPYRVVDVGCGLGFGTRALAAHGRLGRDVELLGCDFNRALVDAAQHLADAEGLACRFHVANAFGLQQPAHVFMSSGVVHHFRGADLNAFFAHQHHGWAMIHHDIQPSVLSPAGAWMFHQARMREPLARHDGVVSARRAHDAATLLAAARASGAFECAVFDSARSFASVMLRPMHALLGCRPALWDALQDALGPLSTRLRSTP